MMWMPAAVLILLGICVLAIPRVRGLAEANAQSFMDQSGYAHSVLDNAEPAAPEIAPDESLASSILRTSVAGVLALLLALGSVFRKRFGQTLRFTRSLELGNSILRKVHSGHPGDYVAWLSAGTALLGGSFFWFLR
jgi:multicomponent Na+:H+ antiporter subunit D